MDPVLYPAEASHCDDLAGPDMFYSHRCEGATLRQLGDHWPQGHEECKWLAVSSSPDKTLTQLPRQSLTPCPSS